jgi:thiol:disulfide interchange protein
MFSLVLAILFIVLSLVLLGTHAIMLMTEWRERMRQNAENRRANPQAPGNPGAGDPHA